MLWQPLQYMIYERTTTDRKERTIRQIQWLQYLTSIFMLNLNIYEVWRFGYEQ